MRVEYIADRLMVTAKKDEDGNPVLYPSRDLSGVRGIAAHHTAGKGGPEAIARWHVLGKWWPGIAYDFVIDDNAGPSKIYQTTDLRRATYHAGLHNRTRIGVAIVGNFDKGVPHPNQLHACAWLCAALCLLLNLKDPGDWVGPAILPGRVVSGHRELFGSSTKLGKTCPGRRFNMTELRELTALTMLDIGSSNLLDHGIQLPQGAYL